MQSVVSLLTTYLPYFILVLTLLVFVHEFGHHFAGLADEYYTSDVAYETGAAYQVEPWEPICIPAAAASVVRQAPIGKPPPTPLATAMMSGRASSAPAHS